MSLAEKCHQGKVPFSSYHHKTTFFIMTYPCWFCLWSTGWGRDCQISLLYSSSSPAFQHWPSYSSVAYCLFSMYLCFSWFLFVLISSFKALRSEWWETSSSLITLIQMLISFGNILTETPRNHVLLAILV